MKQTIIPWWNGSILSMIEYTPTFGDPIENNTRSVHGIEFVIDGRKHVCDLGNFTAFVNKNDELCFYQQRNQFTGLIEIINPHPIAMIDGSSGEYMVVPYRQL